MPVFQLNLRFNYSIIMALNAMISTSDPNGLIEFLMLRSNIRPSA